MVDIQSAIAEIRRGKNKKERKKKKQDKNTMSASATQGGHNKATKITLRPRCALLHHPLPADPICSECGSDGMIPSAT